MPKKILDPRTGAVVFKATPEEMVQERLRKRVSTLEKRVEELELLVKKLLEVDKDE